MNAYTCNTSDIKEKFGCYQSYDKDNNPLIYSGQLDHCVFWSHKFLAATQDGWASESKVLNDGKVGGKL